MPEYRKLLSTLCERIVGVLENPDLLIEWPKKEPEMSEEYIQKYERVVHAIVQRDHLRQSVADWELEIQRLEKEIETAESAKDEALVKRLRSEQTDYKDLRTTTTEALQEVLEEVDSIKTEGQKELETYLQWRESKRFFPRFY